MKDDCSHQVYWLVVFLKVTLWSHRAVVMANFCFLYLLVIRNRGFRIICHMSNCQLVKLVITEPYQSWEMNRAENNHSCVLNPTIVVSTWCQISTECLSYTPENIQLNTEIVWSFKSEIFFSKPSFLRLLVESQCQIFPSTLVARQVRQRIGC